MALISKMEGPNFAFAPGTSVIVAGNPGAGKSTVLNTLCGEAVFRAGVNIGDGMTLVLDKRAVGGVIFLDTPGLTDIKRREQAAKSITEALKTGGPCKLLFVCQLNNGRVRAEDVSTMRVVLEALLNAVPVVQYGIFVNQVGSKVFQLIDDNSPVDTPPIGSRDKIVALTHSALPEGQTTPFWHFEKMNRDIEEEDNRMLEVGSEFWQFFENLPTMEIETEKVEDVRGDDAYDRLVLETELKVTKLLEERELMTKQTEADMEESRREAAVRETRIAELEAIANAANAREQAVAADKEQIAKLEAMIKATSMKEAHAEKMAAQSRDGDGLSKMIGTCYGQQARSFYIAKGPKALQDGHSPPPPMAGLHSGGPWANAFDQVKEHCMNSCVLNMNLGPGDSETFAHSVIEKVEVIRQNGVCYEYLVKVFAKKSCRISINDRAGDTFSLGISRWNQVNYNSELPVIVRITVWRVNK